MTLEAAMLRVLVVDDHPLMRRGIVADLHEAADILVVAEAADGLTAQTFYQEYRPDVTLMDLSMPRCNGVEAIRAICAKDPNACIVAISTHAGDGQVHRALEAGAVGYVLKSELHAGLANLLRSAHEGRRVLTPELRRQLSAGKTEQLTAREHDVLVFVAQGLSNREVGRRLGIAEETVKSYLSNVLQKLQASDRTHAVVIALRRGMLD